MATDLSRAQKLRELLDSLGAVKQECATVQRVFESDTVSREIALVHQQLQTKETVRGWLSFR